MKIQWKKFEFLIKNFSWFLQSWGLSSDLLLKRKEEVFLWRERERVFWVSYQIFSPYSRVIQWVIPVIKKNFADILLKRNFFENYLCLFIRFSLVPESSAPLLPTLSPINFKIFFQSEAKQSLNKVSFYSISNKSASKNFDSSKRKWLIWEEGNGSKWRGSREPRF